MAIPLSWLKKWEPIFRWAVKVFKQSSASNENELYSGQSHFWISFPSASIHFPPIVSGHIVWVFWVASVFVAPSLSSKGYLPSSSRNTITSASARKIQHLEWTRWLFLTYFLCIWSHLRESKRAKLTLARIRWDSFSKPILHLHLPFTKPAVVNPGSAYAAEVFHKHIWWR